MAAAQAATSTAQLTVVQVRQSVDVRSSHSDEQAASMHALMAQ
jgi:hypothetical protein